MGDESRNDPVVIALSNLVAGGVTRGGLTRDHGRQLRWIEGGTVRSPGKPTVILVAGAGEVGLDWLPSCRRWRRRFTSSPTTGPAWAPATALRG